MSVACAAQTPANTSNLPVEPKSQVSSSTAQQDSAAPIQDEKDAKKQRTEEAQRQLNAQKQQHLLGVVPTFNAVYNGKAVPLNAKQKFDLAFSGAITPYQFALTGLVAGIGQANNSFPEYGQGFEGYAKRYGAGYADYFDGAMLGNALFPVILHQDPRYFRRGTGSFRSRFLWAAASTVICRGDNGKLQPNISNVAGNIAAGGISNLYYPEEDRGVGLTFQRSLVVTAEGALGAMLLEFTPDIQKWMSRKRHKEPPPQP